MSLITLYSLHSLLQFTEQVYFPCDFCSCILENSRKLNNHMQKNHKKETESWECSRIRVYSNRNSSVKSNITPPSSDEVVVSPKPVVQLEKTPEYDLTATTSYKTALAERADTQDNNN